MKKINFNDHNIEIVNEKKKLFSSEVKRKVKTIPIKEITAVRKEIFQGNWNSMTITKNYKDEEFIVAEELEEESELESLYNFLLTKKDEIKYEMSLFDIETMEEKKV